MSRLIFVLLMILTFTKSYAAVPNSEIEEKQNKYLEIKDKIQKQTIIYKQTLDQIYKLNSAAKSLGADRSYISQKAQKHESKARILAQEMTELKAELKSRRSDMLKRLRAIYLFSRRDIGQILFSSQTLQDLDKNLSALKRISKKDFVIIKDYAKRLDDLKTKDEKLSAEIKKLALMQSRLVKNESKLIAMQKEKSQLIKNLRKANSNQMQSLLALQSDDWYRSRFEAQSISEITSVAFFETKGSLLPPVSGTQTSSFGTTVDPDYKFRIINKGIEFLSSEPEQVKSVFNGKVVYAGALPGHESQGLYVILDHGDSYMSVYGGLKHTSVELGDEVKARQTIGKNRAGVAMAFEIRYYNEGINPADWFTKAEHNEQRVVLREVSDESKD